MREQGVELLIDLSGDGLFGRRVLEQRHVEVWPITPDLCGPAGDAGDEAQGALAIREGTRAASAPLEIAVKPLEPVGRADAHPVLLRDPRGISFAFKWGDVEPAA